MNATGAQTIPPVSGRGVFYDGRTAAHHDVTIELAAQALRMHAADGSVLAEWPYEALETHSAPQGLLRLGTAANPALPIEQWASVGAATETTPGHYQFTDSTIDPQRFYRIRTP